MRAASILTSAIIIVALSTSAVVAASRSTPATGLPTQAYFTLEGPYDEGKLRSLKLYGFDHMNKVRDNDGNLVSENYGSVNGKVAALVRRKAETGHVLSVTININSSAGHSHYFWDVIGQTFTACQARSKCKITTIKQCQPQDPTAENVSYDPDLEQICPFVAEVIRVPKPEESTPAGLASTAPSPSPSYHRRLIFKHP